MKLRWFVWWVFVLIVNLIFGYLWMIFVFKFKWCGFVLIFKIVFVFLVKFINFLIFVL